MHLPSHHPLAQRARRILAAGGLIFAALSFAQTARSRTTTSTDGTITLSPLEVNTDRDVGYVASASLAGGRLNTERLEFSRGPNAILFGEGSPPA